MREFEGFIFPNGRIVAIPEEEYMAAIEAGKEILVFCGGWAGGYARAFGARKMKMKGVCSFNEYIGYLQTITGNAKLFWKYQF